MFFALEDRKLNLHLPKKNSSPHRKSRHSSSGATVDGRNPAPVMWLIPLFTGLWYAIPSPFHDSHYHLAKVPKARAVKKAATLMPLELSRQNMGRPSCDVPGWQHIFHGKLGNFKSLLEHKLDWEFHCHICFLSGTISGRNYCEHPIPELSGHFGRILNTKQVFEVRLSEVWKWPSDNRVDHPVPQGIPKKTRMRKQDRHVSNYMRTLCLSYAHQMFIMSACFIS